MNINEFCKKAIGVPFKTLGRSSEAWDCWGLMCEAYKEIFNIELPRYDKHYRSVKEKDVIEQLYKDGAECGWYKVDKVQGGDAILIYMEGRAVHVGLAINNEKMLHVDFGVNTCLQYIKYFRVEGIYRYRKSDSKI